MTIDPRSPCVVGTARRTWHPGTDQSWSGEPADTVEVVDTHDGPARVLAASAVFGREGTPEVAIALCGLDDGRRCYALTRETDTMSAVAVDEWVDATVQLRPGPDGTNLLSL
jgi:hypothetical protein